MLKPADKVEYLVSAKYLLGSLTRDLGEVRGLAEFLKWSEPARDPKAPLVPNDPAWTLLHQLDEVIAEHDARPKAEQETGDE